MKSIQVNPVACSRGGSFDAEVALSVDSYSRTDSTRETVQKLVEGGFSTREAAMARAKQEAEHIEGIMLSHARDYLQRYRDAQA